QGAAEHPARLGRGVRAPAAPPSAAPLARAALALYPPAWRARYGDEMLALLDDSHAGLAAVASMAWRALPAWIWPPRHLHARPATPSGPGTWCTCCSRCSPRSRTWPA